MSDFKAIQISGYQVLIDACDEHLLIDRAWKVVSPNRKPYLKWSTTTKGKKHRVSFHRLVLGAKKGQLVDHINGNSLDNRRINLRIVDAVRNAWNRANPCGAKSKFNGVGWSGGSWQVSIRDGKKQHYIGRFKDEVEAAYHYDLASLKYHGEFGRRNFLPLVSE